MKQALVEYVCIASAALCADFSSEATPPLVRRGARRSLQNLRAAIVQIDVDEWNAHDVRLVRRVSMPRLVLMTTPRRRRDQCHGPRRARHTPVHLPGAFPCQMERFPHHVLDTWNVTCIQDMDVAGLRVFGHPLHTRAKVQQPFAQVFDLGVVEEVRA